jgi:protein subunit release factor A
MLFSKDLARTYLKYAQRVGIQAKIISQTDKRIELELKGKDAL